MKRLLLSACTLLGTWAMNAQEVCLETDFYEGIPKNFTLVCYDEMPVKGQDLKKVNGSMEWTTTLVDSEDGMAAVSISHRLYDLPTDNWMITPRLTLPSENVCLKWTARAIHYHLRDGYKVMISTTGNEYYDFEELYSVEEEEYLWTKHYVSLDKYAGKKVYIAFVHNSQNKFMLAVDDIFVGQPTKADFIVEDNTTRFVGNVGTLPVEGKALNSGLGLENGTLTCVVNDTLVLKQTESLSAWQTGVEQKFCFDVPVQVGKATRYQVMAGENVLVKDSIICSYYPRNLFLEKATGTWCVNCPEVISFIQQLEERYGRQMVCVEAHYGPPSYGKDPYHYAPYCTGMKVNSYPTIHVNRDRSNPMGNKRPAEHLKMLKGIISKPTIAKVEMEVAWGEEKETVQTSAKVTFAHDTDNATGKYRVGYVVIEKETQNDSVRQINGVASISQGEYYYLTSPVSTDLMWYTNVVWSEHQAFLGVKNSLPAQLEGGVEYTVETPIAIPAAVSKESDLAIVAIVMNYYTDEVLNVVEVKVPELPSGIRPARQEDEAGHVRVVQDGGDWLVTVADQAPLTVEVITVDGRRVVTQRGEGTVRIAHSQVAGHGLYLLRFSQGGRVWTKKVAF